MSEFTKEELESILNWGDVYCEFGTCWSYKVHKPLMDKIQSMIDNFCEHENHQYYERMNVYECVNCHKVNLR